MHTLQLFFVCLSIGELEYVGDRSLGVKAHKDLLRKPLDSSTERTTAPRHDGGYLLF